MLVLYWTKTCTNFTKHTMYIDLKSC